MSSGSGDLSERFWGSSHLQRGRESIGEKKFYIFGVEGSGNFEKQGGWKILLLNSNKKGEFEQD